MMNKRAMKKQTMSFFLNLGISGLSLCTFSLSSQAVQDCDSELPKTAPHLRYQMRDNGTVTDRITGLTWMRCPLGKQWNGESQACDGEGASFFWQAALKEVQAINENSAHALHQFANKKQWRLPNIKELISLAERSCRTPALNGKAFHLAFPYTGNDGDERAYVWSNTHTVGRDAGEAEIFAFDVRAADVYTYAPTYISGSVLLVSDAPGSD